VKATHLGTCQVCSRVQKLPNGLMAKHGYKVLGGFFSGVCFGSNHLPLEQDKTLVEESIVWATERWLETAAMARIWANPAIEPKRWYHVWIPTTGRLRGYYSWEHCDLKIEKDTVYVLMNKEWKRGNTYGLFAKTPEDLLRIATESHERYIEQALQPKMRELNRYCKNQQWRINTWHKKPLTPIEAKKS
jgi:hypothetical protein